MVIAEYVIVYSKYSPLDIGKLYQVDGLISEDGYVYTKITKGTHGLKQAATIAYKIYFSHGTPWLLPSSIHDWIMNTPNKKYIFVYVWNILV